MNVRTLLAAAGRCVALVTAAALAVACSSPGPAATDAGAPELDREATLRIGLAGPPLTLDPAVLPTQGALPPTFLLYDRLTRLDDDLQVKPMLATAWRFAPDGSSLEFTLREGVRFHDGTPVDATAVKTTLERNKTLPGSTVAPLLDAVTSIDVVDPATVRLNLVPGRGAELPTVLAYAGGEIISPKAIADGRDLALAPGDAGSGPYVVSEFRPGEAITLTRAPGGYWDDDAAKPATVQIVYSAQGSTRLNALRAGQLDLVQLTGPDIKTGEKLAESGAFSIFKTEVLTPYSMFVHGSAPPFTDPRVRQAVSIAIDREAISRDLLGGDCTPRVQPYAPGHWAHADGLEDRLAFDPDRAKQLLAEAGVTDLRFRLAFTAGSTFESIAQAIQAQLAAVGVTVELTPLPSAAAMAGYRQGEHPAYLGSMPTDAEPAQLLQSTYFGGFSAAEGIRDQVVPIAARAADPTLSPEQRGELYRQIWTASAEQASVILLCASKQLWAYSPKVTGVDSMPWRWAGSIDARYLGVMR
ncbi:ABC transporter substrate-binding protein [Pseudonocardia thermophila]|uniref:ABC transporter substrate-binding protein n=1 Tax=Pseudonocardia thermophila TaxID=1848 RepID=UPI00248ED500|nr:ABC transporter substrate-binding protein [Pseudonocardia thermophila]